MKYYLHVLGCQMNYADAERIASVLAATGWSPTDAVDAADLYIFVTCSVKQKAEDRVTGTLERLAEWKAVKPGRRIAITGCMARITSNRESPTLDPLLKRLTPLDVVWRITDTAQLPDLLGEQLAASAPEDDEYYRRFFAIDPARSRPAQVTVPIMTGCDNWCTYCIVPITRGREVSRPKDEIHAECRRAIKNGAIEITLLGQNVDSYQKSSQAFAELLDSVARLEGLQRLRFTSSHPKDIVADVMDVMVRHANIERHLHFAAQHGDDEILARMNRGHTAEEFLAKVALFRSKLPSASVTTDIIVGFPGETEEAFERLKKFYRAAAFEFAFISRYSPRSGTASARMWADDIPRDVKARRWEELNSILKETTIARYAAMQGTTVDVLVERCASGMCEGRSSEFFLTKFLGDESLIGSIQRVEIVNPRETELVGRRIQSH